MTTANPNRIALNLWINLETRADLEYLATYYDTEFATIVREALKRWAWEERQISQGALLILQVGDKNILVSHPGTILPRHFDRAQLAAEGLRRTGS